jgi:DNA-binding NarL/FixJ family response regulator
MVPVGRGDGGQSVPGAAGHCGGIGMGEGRRTRVLGASAVSDDSGAAHTAWCASGEGAADAEDATARGPAVEVEHDDRAPGDAESFELGGESETSPSERAERRILAVERATGGPVLCSDAEELRVELRRALERSMRHGSTTVAVLDVGVEGSSEFETSERFERHLRALAVRRLCTHQRSTDAVAATAEGFSILVADVADDKAAMAVATRVGALLTQPFLLGGRLVSADVRVGIALAEGELDADQLFEAARRARKLATTEDRAVALAFAARRNGAEPTDGEIEATERPGGDGETDAPTGRGLFVRSVSADQARQCSEGTGEDVEHPTDEATIHGGSSSATGLNETARARAAHPAGEARGGSIAVREGPIARLTRTERAVLDGLRAGKSASMLASEFYVSLATIRSHIRAILLKLGVNSQLAAVALANRLLGSLPAADEPAAREVRN